MYNTATQNLVNKDASTIGDLVRELSEIDPATPVQVMCDHCSSLVNLNDKKEGVLHSIHIVLDFSYVSREVKNGR